jgi:hypothetical protein
MGSSGAVPQLGEPQQTLWNIALVTAGTLGFRFSDSASSQIQKMIIQAVKQMEIQSSSDPKFEKARVNTEKFVREIVKHEVGAQEQRKKEALYGGASLQQIELSTIHESAINSALSSLCPGLWPFC